MVDGKLAAFFRKWGSAKVFSRYTSRESGNSQSMDDQVQNDELVIENGKWSVTRVK